MSDRPVATAGGEDEPALASVLFLFAESPVHAGAGGAEAAVDLPIQRSVQTQWPILNDSTVRGGLRRLIRDEKVARKLFGFERQPDDSGPEDEEPHPGRFSTPDAELLLFPLASARGMTSWVTCPNAVQYFLRKLRLFRPRLRSEAQKAVGRLEEYTASSPKIAVENALVPRQSCVAWGDPGDRKLVFESDALNIVDSDDETKFAQKLSDWFVSNVVPFTEPGVSSTESFWGDRFATHFAVISDDAFTHFVRRKTELRTRVTISKGRAKDTGLWTEENLPVDTVLYTVLTVTGQGTGDHLNEFRSKADVAGRPWLQLGGDQNLGRGILRMRELGA